MTILFRCPQCGHGLNAPDAAANRVASCPKCKYDIAVPRESEPVKAVVRRVVASSAEPEPPGFDVLTLEHPEPGLKPAPHSRGLMLVTSASCPRCFNRISLDDPASGQLVRCPHCRHEFRADATPIVHFADDVPEAPQSEPPSTPSGRIFTTAPYAPQRSSSAAALWMIAFFLGILSAPIWLPIVAVLLLVLMLIGLALMGAVSSLLV